MTKKRRNSIRLAAGGLLVLLLLGSISYIVPGRLSNTGKVVAGKYSLTSVNDGELQYFEGPVYFEFADEQSGLKPASVFKLHFINPKASTGRGFGFLIPLRGEHAAIRADRYEVDPDDDNYINRYESVFGYADIIKEEMYFTESGNISINSSSEQEVAGDMNMVLRDQNGQRMRLRGRFNARPLNVQQIY